MGDIRKTRKEAVEAKRKEIDYLVSSELERLNKAKAESELLDAKIFKLIEEMNDKKDKIAILDNKYYDLTKNIEISETKLKEIKESNSREIIRLENEQAKLTQREAGFKKDHEKELALIENLKRQSLDKLTETNNAINFLHHRELEIEKEKKALQKIRENAEASIATLREQETIIKNKKEELSLVESNLKEQRAVNNRELRAIEVGNIKNKEREVALNSKEQALRTKEELLNEREVEVNLKQARVNKLENRVNLIIETNNLKDRL